MTVRGRLTFCAVAASVILHAAAPAQALVIRGDRHWRGAIGCPAGWTEPDLDDSAWNLLSSPFVLMWPKEWWPAGRWQDDPQARPIWPVADINPSNNPSCVRRHFNLDAIPTPPATVHIWVQGDYELYLNGAYVGGSYDRTAAPPGETYDVAALLHAGDNVIALQLTACTGNLWGALFSLAIPNAADAPLAIGDIVNGVAPWLAGIAIASAFVLAMVAIALVRRWAAPRLRRLPAGAVAAGIIVVLFACQWFLQTGQLYSAFFGDPWAAWNWPQVVTAGALVVTLLLVCSGAAESGAETVPPRHEALALAGILLLATFLRTVSLDSVPPGFFQDEAINGLDAVSLFDGRGVQLWSDSIGGRPTLFLYLLGASLKLFGTSYLSLKVLPVLLGVASVAALYWFGRIAAGARIALWAAFFLAVSRWHIHFSRMAWEVNFMPLLSAGAFALLLRGLGRARYPVTAIVAACVILATGMYTYAAFRAIPAVAAVFLIATVLSSERAVVFDRVAALVAGVLVASVLIAPLAYFAWQHPDWYWRRVTDVSITDYMLFNGTPLPWLEQFWKGLLALNGQGDLANFSPDYASHLDPLVGALFLLGVALRPPRDRRLSFRLLWAWFLTVLALVSLTRDSPHATRLLALLPPALLFAGFGAVRFLDYVRSVIAWRPVGVAVGAAVVLFSTGMNAYQYFILMQHQPANIDDRMNVRARTLCETMRQETDARFYWTDDVAYWCKAQCAFLVPGGFKALNIIGVPELLDTRWVRDVPRPVLIVVGQELLDVRREIPRDENGVPLLDLPVRPVVRLNRAARPMYYLYRF